MRVSGSSAVKVIVVDNDSPDGTADLVEQLHPEVSLIRSGENGGFAAGNNLGLRRAAGEWVLLLNPDAILQPGALDSLVSYLDAHSRVGCVGPGMDDDRPNRLHWPEPFMTPGMAVWYALSLQRVLPLNRIDGARTLLWKAPSKSVRVERLIGAALLLRRSALDEVGLMDERFFLYSEEEDLQFRLALAGWETHYEPLARVKHIGGGSSRFTAPVAMASANWSRYLFVRKHFGRLAGEMTRIVWCIATFARMILAILLFATPGFRERMRGYRLSLASLLIPGYFERHLRPPRKSLVATVSQ